MSGNKWKTGGMRDFSQITSFPNPEKVFAGRPQFCSQETSRRNAQFQEKEEIAFNKLNFFPSENNFEVKL